MGVVMRERISFTLGRSGLLCAGVTLLLACATDPVAPAPKVYFVLDAPLCSSSLAVQFSVDGALVGTDIFRVHLPPDHTTSRVFATSLGTHTVGARVVNGFVWPDTTVTLVAGQVFARSLPFYCS